MIFIPGDELLEIACDDIQPAGLLDGTGIGPLRLALPVAPDFHLDLHRPAGNGRRQIRTSAR